MNYTQPAVKQMKSPNLNTRRPGSILSILALAALTGYLSIVATQQEELRDYFLYIAEYASNNFGWRLILQFLLGTFLYLLFAILHYSLVFHPEISQAQPRTRRLLERTGRVAIVIAPSLALAFLFSDAARSTTGTVWVMWLAAAILILGAILQAAIAFFNLAGERTPEHEPARKRPILPAKYFFPLVLIVSFITILILYIWMWNDVIGAANFIGGIGIILLFLVCLALALKAFSFLRRRAGSIAGWLILVIIISQLVGAAAPEFTHTTDSLSETTTPKSPDIEQLANKRGIPSLPSSFQKWIQQPAFLKAQSSNQKYPVFIVAAQGGGLYAAYHTAVSLARLYDQCPRLRNHVFAVSSVSGGSFGAAAFTQLLNRLPALGDDCSLGANDPGALEASVRQFFSYDFLTPVIAAGLFFDLPNLVVPQVRLMHDRARTLELAFERALQLDERAATPFYANWSATGNAPALFFNSASSNYGTPVLISQLYMADSRSRSVFGRLFELSSSLVTRQNPANDAEAREHSLRRALVESVRASEYTRPAYFNILEYRPDLQLALSTASILSARFPYVTPPGILYGDTSRRALDSTLRETNGLQLIDGGFWDNSGIGTGIEIIRQLKGAQETKDLTAGIDFHLISFGHSRGALQKGGTRDVQSELVAPITTFEAVREARRFTPSDATTAGYKAVHAYELFDHAFRAPLSWTLSERVRSLIEARSGGKAKPSLCCELELPAFARLLFPQIIIDPGYLKPYMEKEDGAQAPGLKLLAPNERHFNAIISAVRRVGAEAK